FFTYDFAQTDLLIKVFTNAINEDSRDAIETEGEYGKRYKALLAELNLLLANKKVNISTDFSTITFKLDTNDKNIELYPEDLSHGELKRLTIYLWLKYNKIEDAIVLMDEIEIGFHPDWQYRIIPDLEQWSPSNQYILATHSYELCQALTPAHVRELEPKLIKSDNNISL
ncbi:MAG: AAA family ATPase, partial [Aphanizomenon sp.]